MRTLRRPIAMLLLVLLLPGCAGPGRWTAQSVTPQESKRTLYAGDVRLTVADGTVLRLRGAWVGQDSLGGWLREPAGEEYAVALTDVVRLDTRSGRPAAGSARGIAHNKTAIAVFLLAAVVAIAAVAISSIQFGLPSYGPFGGG